MKMTRFAFHLLDCSQVNCNEFTYVAISDTYRVSVPGYNYIIPKKSVAYILEDLAYDSPQ